MLLLANTTNISSAARAIEYKKAAIYSPPTEESGFDVSTIKSGLWLVVGKTSPWADEDFPNEPSPYLKRIPEEKAFWYVKTVKIVFPHPTGTITTQRGTYLPVDELSASIISESGKTSALVDASISSGSLPGGFDYRMAGLCSNLEFSTAPSDAVIQGGAPLSVTSVNSYVLHWAASFKKFNGSVASALSFQIFIDF